MRSERREVRDISKDVLEALKNVKREKCIGFKELKQMEKMNN